MDERLEPGATPDHSTDATREAKRRRRVQVATGVLMLLASVTWSMWAVLLNSTASSSLRAGAGVATIFMVGLAIGTLNYLQPTRARRRTATATRGYVDDRIAALERTITVPHAPIVPEGDRMLAIAALSDQMRHSAAETIVSEMRKQAAREADARNFDAKADQMEQRIARQILDLAKRGNVNLVLGMCTTLLGLCFLGYSLLTSPTTATTDLLIHFAPRFSFALLIEVFAYFFLQLYKQSLGEIKYFQNELTNVESRALATQVARHANDPDLLRKIALNLASTERNFVLERGQSTVDLERERMSQAANEKLLDALTATRKNDTE